MNRFLDNLMNSGIIQISVVALGIVFTVGMVRSCEKEKRNARLDCIKTKNVSECRMLITN